MGNLFNFGSTATPSTTPKTSTSSSGSKVILPPGVDPYYGITVSNLPGVKLSGGDDTNTSNPLLNLPGFIPSNKSNSGTSYKAPTGSSRYFPTFNENGSQKVDLKALTEAYKNAPDRPSNVPKGATYDPQSGRWFIMTADPNTNTSREQWYGDPSWRAGSSSGGSSSSGGGFRIAKPNMTWINNMPSVMPPGGEALLAMYGPAAFSLMANTPQVPTTPRGLTYNNPYNTNPYLPTANPFALIANSPPSGS